MKLLLERLAKIWNTDNIRLYQLCTTVGIYCWRIHYITIHSFSKMQNGIAILEDSLLVWFLVLFVCLFVYKTKQTLTPSFQQSYSKVEILCSHKFCPSLLNIYLQYPKFENNQHIFKQVKGWSKSCTFRQWKIIQD